MSFTAQQSLRQDLLLRVLEIVKDPDETLRLAADFERFIMSGSMEASNEQADSLANADVPQTSEEGTSDLRLRAASEPKEAAAIMPATPEIPETPRAKPETERKLKRPRWSQEEDSRLTTLWNDGISIKDIAAHLGRTTASINGRIRALALPNRLKRAGSSRAQKTEATSREQASAGSAACSTSTQRIAQSSSKETPTKGALRRGWSKRRKKRVSEAESKAAEEERASAVAQYVATFGASQAPVSLNTVVTFLRSRDYSIVRRDDGTFLLDEREVLSPSDLLKRANMVRDRLGKSPFPDQVLSTQIELDQTVAASA